MVRGQCPPGSAAGGISVEGGAISNVRLTPGDQCDSDADVTTEKAVRMRMEDFRDLRTRIQALRYELAGERMMLAAIRFGLTLERCANFDPAQPRDELGRWTDGGGNSSIGSRDPSEGDRTRAAGSPDWGSIDLRMEEGPAGGHTIARHVGKSDEELLALASADLTSGTARKRGEVRAGSFETLDGANVFVDEALRSNADRVASVGSGLSPASAIYESFDRPTGREVVLDVMDRNVRFRTTYGVAVFIIHDPGRLRGYRIHTAYPMNFD